MTEPAHSPAIIRSIALTAGADADADADACARMMAASEPWISLGFGYEACRSRTSDPEKEVLAADVEGELAGFLILDMRGPFAGYIQTVCVDAARRGHGIGSALIRAAEERILRESPNVFLCVSATNDRARALYERLGYVRIGELPDFLARDHTEVLMRRTSGPLRDFRAVTPAREDGENGPGRAGVRR